MLFSSLFQFALMYLFKIPIFGTFLNSDTQWVLVSAAMQCNMLTDGR